ncbi:hypothetical protein ANN_26802 [Periplaneta americana]|uniref:Uncharacterized protein n=1 Tax=Periplaneta americana TaxID=6978 RepID=A0ABQ8RZ25_PERAM|nr:hypothetical protein ANN_26802 [Periplaneta americana]
MCPKVSVKCVIVPLQKQLKETKEQKEVRPSYRWKPSYARRVRRGGWFIKQSGQSKRKSIVPRIVDITTMTMLQNFGFSLLEDAKSCFMRLEDLDLAAAEREELIDLCCDSTLAMSPIHYVGFFLIMHYRTLSIYIKESYCNVVAILNTVLVIQRLQKQLADVKSEPENAQKKLDECPEIKKIDIIKEAPNEKNQKAVYLLDQIHNYERKKPEWSEQSILYCVAWRIASPKGYEHGRTSGFISAPSRSTLDRCRKMPKLWEKKTQRVRNDESKLRLALQQVIDEGRSIRAVAKEMRIRKENSARGRKRARTRIITDTPEKKYIEEETGRKKSKSAPKSTNTSSVKSLNFEQIEYIDSSDDDLFEVENEEDFDFNSEDFEKNDFVLVKFEGEKSVVHCVGRVEEVERDGDLIVNFMKRK